MQEKNVLVDCLESLKHAAERYQEGAFEADSDQVRDTLQDIMFDRCEQQASVFSLMHQMDLYQTERAPDAQLQKIRETYERQAQKMESRHRRVEEGHAQGAKVR